MANKQLTGRTTEQNAIEQALNKACRGIPQVVVVSGHAGAGKSTLIRNLVKPQGCRIIETNLPETETSSYHVVANLLRQTRFLETIPENDREYYHSFTRYMLPEIRNESTSFGSADFPAQFLIRVTEHLTSKGMLLWIIEDFHFADHASLDLITNLFTSGKEIPLAIVATCRIEQMPRDHALRKVIIKFRRHSWFSEIRLQPFTGNDISNFVEARYHRKPAEEFTKLLLGQTGGLPLLVNEIMVTLQKKDLLTVDKNGHLQMEQPVDFPIPDKVVDLVILQMDGLSAGARDLAELFACYGMEAPFTLLDAFTPDPQVIDELQEKGVIMEKAPGKGSFRHELFREAIRSGILWSRRRSIYKTIVDVLERQPAPAAVMGDFYEKAGMTGKAIQAYVKSARESCESYAFSDSAHWAKKALNLWHPGEEETERLKVLEEFAWCSKTGGDIHHAVKALKEISENSITSANPGKMAFIFSELSVLNGMLGAQTESQDFRLKAASTYTKADMPGEAALEYMNLAEQKIGQLDLTAAYNYSEKAILLAKEAEQQELLARATALQGYVCSFRGDTETGIQLAEEAVAMALQANDVTATAEVYRRLAGTIEYASDFRKAIDVYETAWHFCSTNQLSYHETQCLGCMSWVLMRLGDWKRSFETCREIISHSGSDAVSKATANSVLAIMRSYRGEIKTAHRHLDLAGKYAAQIGSHIHMLLNKWPKALLAEAEADFEKAQQHYSWFLDIWFESEDRHDAISGICDAASFFARHNNQRELKRTVKAMTIISELSNNQEATGIFIFTVGLSLFLDGNHEQAAVHLQKSLEYLSAAAIPVQIAIVQFHLGTIALKLDQPAKSETCYKEAYNTFKKLGIRHWCSLIEKQAPSDTSKKSGPDAHVLISSLTNRQREILELITEGLTNKEIASKINLSTRTIDMHIRNIFDRLNCRTRTEAAKTAMSFKQET